jgi:hypothetical protein
VRFTYKGNDTDKAPEGVPVVGDDGAATGRYEEVTTAPYFNSHHYSAATSKEEFIGLIAQDAQGPMPELVKTNVGFIDGTAVDDLLTIDSGPLVYALVNAVKQLAAKVEALEARVPA